VEAIIVETAVPSMQTISLLRFEFLRAVRDLKALVWLAVIFGSPFLAAWAGASVTKVQMFTTLFLPVIVGWSWGADVASGRLIQLAVGRYSRGQLLLAREIIFASLFTAGVLAVALVSGASIQEMMTMVLFTLHVTLLGFFLSTSFRSAEAGWLPVVAAFVGAWFPMLLVMKQTGGAMPQWWLHWLSAIFLPQFAISLQFFSARQLILMFACTSGLWGTLAYLVLQRSSALHGRGSD
jgi:hypothetical protein